MEEADCCRFLDSLVLHDVVKQFAATCILHDQVELLRCLNDLVELDDVRVPDHLQDVDLPRDSLHVVHVLYLVLLKYFDGNLLEVIVVKFGFAVKLTFSLVSSCTPSLTFPNVPFPIVLLRT